MSVNESVGFSYTGAVKGVTLKKAGYYKLEVWGAQGGTYTADSQYQTSTGGYGGYSVGIYSASINGVLYVVVGGAGESGNNQLSTLTGGYNGGGGSGYGGSSKSTGRTGGGATHIATRTGLLKNLSSYQSSILIVAGGGGGTRNTSAGRVGGVGGGMNGGRGRNDTGGFALMGGTQTKSYNECDVCNSGAGFGVGGTSTAGNHPGGGGGWYGGDGGNYAGANSSGGGGSGYIGNSLLLSAKSITKQMYMYNSDCTSSTAAATKTTCISNTGAHTANAANTGNGYARITYLGT